MSRHIPNVFLCALPLAGALCCAPAVIAQPVNDDCANATPALVGGLTLGSLLGATPDGDSSCSGGAAPDAYHTLTTTIDGVYVLSLCGGASWDSVLSLHATCPATGDTEIACDDDGCRPSSGAPGGYTSTLAAYLAANTTYLVRVAPFDSTVAADDYALTIVGPTPRTGACCRLGGCTIVTRPACTAPPGGAPAGLYGGDFSACLLPAHAPTTYSDAPGPFAIPDNSPEGLTRTLSIPDSFSIGDARLTLVINHGFVGDLTIRLIHGASSATILEHVGIGPLGSDATLTGQYVFTDAAPATVWPYAPSAASGHPVPQGEYLCAGADAGAIGLCQQFSGMDAAGDWSLQIVDSAPGYSGELVSWSLLLDRSGADTCTSLGGACCTGAHCVVMTFDQCAQAGGAFKGAGAVCTDGPNNPTTCCKANFNGANGLTVQDIFDYLSAWFASDPRTDFDGGGIAISDIFAFINAWFAGC